MGALSGFFCRLAFVGFHLAIGIGVAMALIVFGVLQAQRDVVDVLENKAAAEALKLRDYLVLGLDMGMPFDHIRGAYNYLEGNAQSDPDIRFLVITDTDFQRLHYGGIGKRKLDPLLSLEDLPVVGANLADQQVGSVDATGYAMVLTPIISGGTLYGFAVVGVQAKQVREALQAEFLEFWPFLVAALLLLVELGLWQAGRIIVGPFSRLQRLLAQFAADSVEWSQRHADTEVGRTLRTYNGIVYRFGERIQALRDQAQDVHRAVFDTTIRGEVDARSKRFEAEVGRLWNSVDPAGWRQNRLFAEDLSLPATILTALAFLQLTPSLFHGQWQPIAVAVITFLLGSQLHAYAGRAILGLVASAALIVIAAIPALPYVDGSAEALVRAGLVGGAAAAMLVALRVALRRRVLRQALLRPLVVGGIAGFLLGHQFVGVAHISNVLPLVVCGALAMLILPLADGIAFRALCNRREVGK